MSSDEIDQSDHRNLDTNQAEVEFALILSRMIHSVSDDQDQLRQAVYDLARYKLREELTHSASPADSHRAERALETAIQGVESFSRRTGGLPRPAPLPQLTGEVTPAAEQYQPQAPSRPARPAISYPDDEPVVVVHSYPRKSGRWAAIGRVAGLIVVLVAILAGIRHWQELSSLGGIWTAGKSPAVSAAAKVASAPSAAEPVAAKPSPLVPTNFGVYGISGGRLFELSQLPGRAQDPRVALSPTLATPHPATLPNGHVKFIVYRREAAYSIPDRAEVRIIAKVTHATSFDAAGKPVVSDDNGWYVRNISFSYRIAPVPQNTEMFEIQPEDSTQELSPGRYALILKGLMYDFVVDGTVTDPRHCLERLTATNGVFVSQCKTP